MTVALALTDLSKSFPVGRRLFGPPTAQVRAVRPVTLSVRRGETLGIVGESGCGKSTLARMLVGLLEPTTGTIEIEGAALDTADPAEFGRKIQYVFQDPISSLNPRKTIRQVIEAPLKRLHGMNRARRTERIAEIFDLVSLREEFLDRYPHEFSGGQAQRIGIARALAAAPRILILDEPVSALDVSVQAQVLNLLARLKAELGLTYIFISHDLAVVEAVSDRIAVLYFGAVVETGPADAVFAHPRHPYTKLLAESAPVVGRLLAAPEGKDTELPDPLNPPAGCAFRARCPRAVDRCAAEDPPLMDMGSGQEAACFNPIPRREAAGVVPGAEPTPRPGP
jgi:peptide/nickel transport system ATP-binding protein